ncbi:MAG: hypothetical protein ABEJ43_11395 [Haloferacaceae archaeon]
MRSSALVVALALVGVMLVSPASTYSTATLGRTAGIDVADDPNAVIGVSTPPPGQGNKFEGELATVTNRFEETRTFTVTIDSSRNKYDLVAEEQTGNSVTVTLAQGEQTTIEYERAGGPPGNGNRGSSDKGGGPPAPTLTFTVETDGTVSASLTRTREGN